MSLVVNFWGGPATSKSTKAAGLFYKLKMSGVSCELVTEYCKELVWRGDLKRLGNQFYVSAAQHDRILQCYDQVDVVVTDSPILLGAAYNHTNSKALAEWIAEAFAGFENLNILLERDLKACPYSTVGRYQDEAGAIAKDKEVKALLNRCGVPYVTMQVSGERTVNDLFLMVMDRLGVKVPLSYKLRMRLTEVLTPRMRVGNITGDFKNGS